MILRGAALAVLLAGQAAAEAPATSPLPEPRPVIEAPVIEAPLAKAPSVRPQPRPDFQPGTLAPASRRGQLCDIPGVEGERIARVTSPVVGCGIPDPVRVRAIAGVRLSQPATMDCSVVHALDTWVDRVLQPVFDGQVRVLQIAGSYNCRGRNNQRGAKISEHGRGRAIDIAGLTFADGHIITVARDWNKGLRGRLMAEAYKRGCGIFGTTLGPGSDGYHEDHMHFDMPLNRRSPYCR